MRKTILVTGGSGFIGSYLCQKLLDLGEQIICLDNISTGNQRNIAPLLSHKQFTFIQADITDPQSLDFLKKKKIDEIYHLASPASVTYIVDRPIEAALVNSIGSKNLLDLAHQQKAKILFASSSEAYGDPHEHPQKETYWGNTNPVGIRSGYDEGKRFGEALFMAYHRELSVPTRIVRIFNTYGPNSNPHDSRVIPTLVTQALKNQPLTIHGDGTQTRSLCYVSDMVEGIYQLMQSNETGPINIGNTDETTILEIAQKILQLTKSKSKLIFVARPQDDPSKRKPDISLAKKKLNWSPQVGLEQGLKLTIDYFQKIL